MSKIRKFAALVSVTIILMFVLGKAVAQSNYYIEEQRTFYGGLLAGANFAQVDGDNFAGYHKVGLNVGGIVYAQLEEHLAVSLEILFSQKGSKSNIEQPSGNPGVIITDYGLDLDYAEVPVMISYFDKRKSHFGAGFSYSQLVSGEEKIVTTPANNVVTSDYPMKKGDLNFVAGGNLHLVQGLFLNIRFQYSLLPIRDKIPPGYGRSTEQFNNLWVLRLMYLFQ